MLQRPEFSYAGLIQVIDSIATQQLLDPKHKDHKLSGKYHGYKECHIAFDILLVYKMYKKENVLLLDKLGTHDELFE